MRRENKMREDPRIFTVVFFDYSYTQLLHTALLYHSVCLSSLCDLGR
jgi:hypothetical protein